LNQWGDTPLSPHNIQQICSLHLVPHFLPFSLGRCTKALQPNILNWLKFTFSSVHASSGVIYFTALVGERFFR
jgi:hypothetical protein